MKKITKSVKQTPKKMQPSMNPKDAVKSNAYFLGLIAVFAGVSLYAVFSFSGSTSNYIKGMYASVVGAEEGLVVEVVDNSYEIFSDVRSNGAHSVAIEKLRDLGVFGGYPDGTFRPDEVATRAVVLAVLETAVDVDFSGASYGGCFKDVKNEWFAVPVCYAQKQGWVSGLKDGRFGPNEGIKYPEALKIAITVFGFNVPESVEVSPMTGINVTDWYAPYFKTAIDFGLIDADFIFSASHRLTRAELAELVYQTMKVKKLF